MDKRREEMMDALIRLLGFENEWTIWFCQICEDPKMTPSIIRLCFTEALING